MKTANQNPVEEKDRAGGTLPAQDPAVASLVVCGKFHYLNYVQALAETGVLRQLIYSHKIGSKQRLGLGPYATNLWLKEYLYQGHARTLGNVALARLGGWYHMLWEWQLARLLQPVPLVHFLLHGNCLNALQRAKARGSYLLAEPVNSHPDDYRRLVDEEFHELGLKVPRRNQRAEGNYLKELALADSLLVPSLFLEESYRKHGFPADRIKRIPYGVNLSAFCPAPDAGIGLHQKTFKVICVAQIHPRKGQHYLLRAWKMLALPNAELHFYGLMDKNLMPKLLEIGAKNAYFHGGVSRQVLIREFQDSSAFVLPTVEDGFGYVITEAMACGVPVIATTNSGAPDIITQGENGFIVAIRDVNALAERIGWIYENREEAQRIGRQGRKLVESRYSWQGYALQVAAHYAECLAKPRK